MDRDALLTLAVAVCCLVAVGMATTTLETAVETDPSEVINPDYAALPIDSSDAEELREQIEGGRELVTSADSADGEAESSANADERERSVSQQQKQQQRQQQQQQQQERERQSADAADPDRSLLDRLLSLLESALQLLLRAAPFLLLAGALVTAVGYRDRIVAALRGRFGTAATATDGGSDARPAPRTPTNAVADAWLAMVARARLDDPRALTPRECERAAVEAGLDRDLVAEVTAAFEDVRYGGAPVTEERQRRAEEWLARLRADDVDADAEAERNAATKPGAGG